MELHPEQATALERILAWIDNPGTKAYFTLGGLAGTGKTTLISILCDRLKELKIPFVVGCPTGKAAAVLASKGVPASTVHKLCYECQGRDSKGVVQFEFTGIPDPDSERFLALMIVDESSMVSTTMMNDLLSSGIPILFAGDYGQLPPVKDDPKLMQTLDVKLEHVHRQSNYLLDVSYLFRARQTLMKHFTAHPDIARYAMQGTPDANEWIDDADIVLVATNAMRHAYNRKRLYGVLGIDWGPIDKLPETRNNIAEALVTNAQPIPVVCVSNSYSDELMNGETGWLFPLGMHGEGLMRSVWRDTRKGDGPEKHVLVNCSTFFGEPSKVNYKAPGLKVDFGWAITVHKAQGSEWDHVGVIDPGVGQRDPDDYARWRYTAATRAKQRLTWIGVRPRS